MFHNPAFLLSLGVLKVSAKSTRFFGVLLIAIAIIIPLVLFSTGFFAPATERVLPGIEVMGKSLGGVNKTEGLEILSELEKNLRARRVILRYNDLSWPLLPNEAGFCLNKEVIMDQALSAGRQGSPLQRWKDRNHMKMAGCVIDPVFEFDQEKLAGRVKELTQEITEEPKDATLKIGDNDSVVVLPSHNGVGVDFDRLKKDLSTVLKSGGKPEVFLTLAPVAPARTTETVHSMGVNTLLAKYTTGFDPANVSRTYNISVAARALDELLIMPDHVVSFNEVVGPRSSEAGYKTALVIINNEFVDGIGGGVCQVSTTLYNCVLLANLEIVERTCHSLPVGYVPIGRDATVVYDALDFKFRNNTESYLYLKSYVYGGQVTFKIFGNVADKKDVSISTWITREIESGVIYEDDPNLPKGEQLVKQEGASGFMASGERVVMSNGRVEKREAISFSEYSPMNKIITVGTSEKAVPQIAPSTPSSGVVRPPGQQNELPDRLYGSGQDAETGSRGGEAGNRDVPETKPPR